MRQLRRRFPEEPYRQRLGAMAERIRRTRAAMTGEPGARAGGYAGARRSTRSWPRSSTRWSRTGSAGWPGARSRSCAGSWGRSGSTSPRSRSASTPRPTGRRWRPCGRAPEPDAEVAAGVTVGRGAGDVPGDRAAPGEVRRRGVPAVRDLVHDQPRRRRGVLELARRAAEPEPFGRPVAALTDLPPDLPVLDVVPAARERRRPVAARPSSSTACSRTRPTAPTSGIAATPRR